MREGFRWRNQSIVLISTGLSLLGGHLETTLFAQRRDSPSEAVRLCDAGRKEGKQKIHHMIDNVEVPLPIADQISKWSRERQDRPQIVWALRHRTCAYLQKIIILSPAGQQAGPPNKQGNQ